MVTVLLTTVSMWYSKSVEFVYLAYLKRYIYSIAPHFPLLPKPLLTTILLSASLSLAVLDISCRWDHTVLTFLTGLFHLAQCPLGSSVLHQVTEFSSLLGRGFYCVCVSIYLCLYLSHFL